MGFKYYHAENSTRVFNVNGREVLFQPYSYFGGTWRGIYATEDEVIQSGLDNMTLTPQNAIQEITREDYEAKRESLPAHLKETYNPVDKNVAKVIKAPITPTKSGKPATIEVDPEAKSDVRNPEEPKAEGEPVAEAADALNVGPIASSAEVKVQSAESKKKKKAE